MINKEDIMRLDLVLGFRLVKNYCCRNIYQIVTKQLSLNN